MYCDMHCWLTNAMHVRHHDHDVTHYRSSNKSQHFQWLFTITDNEPTTYIVPRKFELLTSEDFNPIVWQVRSGCFDRLRKEFLINYQLSFYNIVLFSSRWGPAHWNHNEPRVTLWLEFIYRVGDEHTKAT
jgi:hypothetical protein